MEFTTGITTPVCPTEYFVNVDGLADDVDDLEKELENDDDLEDDEDDEFATDDDEEDDDEDEEV